MLLDRLESGFLLFETPQGMVRAELSLRQRVRLLWTFRHFRQLSIPLLNERERALVNDLFRHNARVILPSDHSSPVIGVIENFIPPQTEVPAELPDASLPVLEPIQQGQQEDRKPPAQTADLPALASARFIAVKVASQNLASQPLPTLKLATPALSATVAVLSIGLISVVALRGLRATPDSQAHKPASAESYRLNVGSDSSLVPKPAAIAESRAALSTPAVPVQSTGEQITVRMAEA